MQFGNDVIHEIQDAEPVIASTYHKCATLSHAHVPDESAIMPGV